MVKKLKKGESYIWGFGIGFIIGSVIGIPIFFFRIPPAIQIIVYLLFCTCGGLIILGAGLRRIRERYNAIPTFLGSPVGSPVKVILGDGWMWWFPSWLGGGIMGAVPIAKQNKEVVIGSFTNGTAIYTKDGVKAEVVLTIIFQITDPWKWVVDFEGDPQEVISDSAERTVRWFTDSVSAEDLVKLNRVLSALLRGEYEGQSHITYQRHKRNESDTETVQLALDPEVTKNNLSRQVEKLGVSIASVMVRSLKVDPAIEEEWQERAAESAQREAERADIETTIMLVKKLMDEAGMTREEARNMVETLRNRGTRQIYTVEGLEQAVQAIIVAMKK